MVRKQFYTAVNLAAALASGQPLLPEAALAHRLTRVLRLPVGTEVLLFNGREGRFLATLTDAKKGLLTLTHQLTPQPAAIPGLTLALCLPKKDTFETVLRQATELGVSHIFPLLSQHAVPDKFNQAKAELKLIDAAEQCERLTLPVLAALQPLTSWLAVQTSPFGWAYERLASTSPTLPPATLLIGPEGGFSAAEIQLLQNHPHVVPFSLGSTILRVDTAAVAALARSR